MSLYAYRFYLDDILVNLDYPESTSKKLDRFEERVFLRESLSGILKALRGDFNKVWAQDLDHKFELRIERKTLSINPSYLPYMKGYFYKTDCGFDEDKKIADITTTIVDRYDKLLNSMDIEYDLIKDLKPPAYEVNYKKYPLLQIVMPFHGEIFNIVSDTFWIEKIPEYSTSSLLDFGFAAPNLNLVFIAGTADLTPDVSGIYQRTFGSPNYVYVRLDGIYKIQRISLTRYGIIEVIPNTVVYRMPDFEEFSPNVEPFGEYNVFTSISMSQVCNAFPFNGYQRMLTDLDEVSSIPTIPKPDPDIGDLSWSYKNYVDPSSYSDLFAVVFPLDTHDPEPTELGKYSSTALHFADEYFVLDQNLPSKIFPIMPKSWKEYLLLMWRTASNETLVIDASSDIVLKNGYKLVDVIKLLLAKIDPTINFEIDSAYSQFLFLDPDPLNGDENPFTHFITPKTNITKGNYNNKATKSPITFGIVDEILVNGLNCQWYITDDGMFKIEHIKFFKNGLSYTTQIIGADLTTQTDPYTTQKWAYHTKEYKYQKQILPELIKFSWMDVVSDTFTGFPIKPISGFVQKGNIQDKKLSSFTSDLDFAQANVEEISKDGLFILAAIFDGVYKVQFTKLSISGIPDILVQNGFWSFPYLHDKFHRFNLPSLAVNLNNLDQTATTTKRAKEQDIVMPAPIEPNEMRLIRSSIGVGEVVSMEINLTTRENKIKLLHDLDFLNPG